MCRDCIRDEVALCWRRQGTVNPTGPGAAPSLARVRRWPTIAGNSQDLCICWSLAVDPFQDHCHECRIRAFYDQTRDKWLTEDILRNRTPAVISGKKHCYLNGGTVQYFISQEQQANRNQRGRACPCGKKPKEAPAQRRQEYITYCLACMGVKIWLNELPEHYQQHKLQDRVFSLRSGNKQAYAVTKGPNRAARHHLFRVNIERGWVNQDPFVDRTY